MSDKRRKLSQTIVDEIHAAYDQWASDPYSQDGMTAEELAAKFNISKATMYLLRRNDWDLSRRASQSGSAGQMNRNAARITDLERRMLDMQAQIDELQAEVQRLKIRPVP